MTVDHFNRHSVLNPVPDPEALAASAWSDAALLEAIDRKAAGEPGSPRPSALQRRSWRGPIAAATAMAVVLVLGAVTVLTRLPRADDAADSGSQPTTTTSGLSVHEASGTLDTVLGPIPWVHASGGSGLPAGVESVIRTPAGFVAVRAIVDTSGGVTSEWLTSADGVTWAVDEFPVPVDGIVQVGGAPGGYWMTSEAGIWLSDDAETWTQVALPELSPPSSTGLVWTDHVGSLAVANGVTVLSWRAHPELPIGEMFRAPGAQFSGGVIAVSCTWHWESPCSNADAIDELVVLGLGADVDDYTVIAHLRLESIGAAVSVVDVETGMPIHELSIAGLRGDEIVGGLNTDSLDWNTIGVIGSGSSSLGVVPAPWPSSGVVTVEIVAADGRFLAFVDTGDPHDPASPADFEVWESGDGITWARRGVADFGTELPDDSHVQLIPRGDGLGAFVEYDLDLEEPREIWLWSSNGLDWTAVPPSAPADDVEQVPGGFVAFGEHVFLSPDGATWERLDVLDQTPRSAALVDGILIVSYEDDGIYETWAFDMGAA